MVNTILQPQMMAAPQPDEVKGPSPYKIPGRHKERAMSQSGIDQGGYSDAPLHTPMPYSWRMRSQGAQEPGLPPHQSLKAPAETLDANDKGKRPESARRLHKPAPDIMHEELLTPGRIPKAMVQDVFDSGDESTIEPGTACSRHQANTPDGGLSGPDIKTEDMDVTDVGEGTVPLHSSTMMAIEELALWARLPVCREARRRQLQDEATAGAKRIFNSIGEENPTSENYKKVYMSLLGSLMSAYLEWKASSRPSTPEPKRLRKEQPRPPAPIPEEASRGAQRHNEQYEKDTGPPINPLDHAFYSLSVPQGLGEPLADFARRQATAQSIRDTPVPAP
jgi:hypothetical protein